MRGTEVYGDKFDNNSAWAVKFGGFDFNFTHFKVESKDKSYLREYLKDDLMGKMQEDELLRDNARIKDCGGVSVYIKNKEKRQPPYYDSKLFLVRINGQVLLDGVTYIAGKGQ